jgi:hypothetical protein
MKMDVVLALTVILNAVKDLLYVFDPLETDNKQILRRGVYPEHGRRAPQNDIATSPQGDGQQAYNPNFRRRIRRPRRVHSSNILFSFVLFVTFVVKYPS